MRQSCISHILEKARPLYEKYKAKIALPTDLAWIEKEVRCEAAFDRIPKEATVLDIGMNTAAYYRKVILNANTVFINGPMGVFEQEASGIGTEISGMHWLIQRVVQCLVAATALVLRKNMAYQTKWDIYVQEER